MSDLAQFEARLSKLEVEHARETSRIVELLKKMEQRLVGSLDMDTPGLITNVREIKREVDETAKHIAELRVEIAALKLAQVADSKAMQDLVEMKQQLPRIWAKIRTYERYRYLIVGGLFVLGFLANKAWEIFLSKK